MKFSSPSIIRVIKSRRMRRWVGRIARMEEITNTYKMLGGKPDRKRPHEKT
jgi:hypothetical protein